MKSKAIFYHAGCPVCVEAEQSVANALDKQDYDVEIVHLADQQSSSLRIQFLLLAFIPPFLSKFS